MAGLSDIPCVGKIVDRISDATVEALFRGLHYLFCYKGLVNELNSEIEIVNIEEVRVSSKAVAARDDGKIIYYHVLKWQTDLEEIQESAKEFSETYKNRSSWRCIRCLPFPNPVTRFRLGREAVHMEKRVTELYDSSKDLLANEIAYLPPVENAPLTDTVFQNFESRKDAYGKLWEALVTEGSSWRDALGQLEKGNAEKISGIDPHVYACVKLSIDRLEEDARSCLFLCSLFPEDAGIYIQKLIQLAIGSQLVLDGESRVCAMVDILISSSLVLNSRKDHIIKLHDLVRDVARSMAVTDPNYAFKLVRCGSRMPDHADYDTRKLLHLHLEKNDFHFPGDLVCQDLHSLLVQCNNHIQQFSGGFFSMFVNIRFLLIEGIYSSLKLQFSLQPLVKLTTLILDDCEVTLDQKNVSFFPENLETLCFRKCKITVPLLLPNLKHLRKLEIEEQWETGLELVSNTISNLPNLEELHIPKGFKIWDDGSEKSLDAVSVPILAEISKLTSLKSLQMLFMNSEPFHDTSIFENLLEYKICVGKSSMFHQLLEPVVSLKRSIELNGKQFEGSESLIERAEEVKLCRTDINISSIYNISREAFADLRKLYIARCSTMEYLISQDGIQHSLQPRTSLSKLTILEINGCSMLKYLFSNSVARCLVQLKQLRIEHCDVMEAIVVNEGASNGDIITFSKLKSLKLFRSPKLKSFYKEKKDMDSSSASIVDNSAVFLVQSRPLFNGMVAFPYLEKLKLKGLDEAMSDIWENYYYNNDSDNIVSSSSFCKLKRLEVSTCNKLETVIPLAMLKRLRNLEYLSIWNCNSLRNVFLPSSIARKHIIHLKVLDVQRCDIMSEIIGGVEDEQEEDLTDEAILDFPELTKLNLYDLPRLSSFWCYQSTVRAKSYKVQFPNLVNFVLGSCGELNLDVIELGRDDSSCQLRSLSIECDEELLFPYSLLRRLYNLEKLTLIESWPNQLKPLCFQRLKVLNVHSPGCSTLLTFSAFRSLQQLQKLVISGSDVLEEIFEDIRVDEASAGIDKKTITLFHLTSVVLKDLPNLKCFLRSALYECHVPALEDLKVDNCGLSALFSCSVFQSLQQLKELTVSNCILLEGIVEDVRDDETSFVNDKIVSHLTSVVLKDLPNLNFFIPSANHECHMPALKELVIDNCGISTLFTCSVFQSLQQLKELTVSNCILLKGIVEDVRDDETSFVNDKIVFHLTSVVLKDLPNLKSFILSANHECHMPALERVVIDNCGLSTLFTCSVFQSLQQLKELTVSNCILLEGIVEDARDDEISFTNDKIITVYQLLSVILLYLPNLKSFSSTSRYAFSMPKLCTFWMFGCPQVENFTSLKTSTGLVSVYSECHPEWYPSPAREKFSDLNDCVRQIREGASSLSDSAGESSYSDQELETELERVLPRWPISKKKRTRRKASGNVGQ